ncbi:MAG: hypothetical protein QF473_28730 [Planctomycetota bacterium]|jgi:hypothetical protein|nr:hypothetical protein [Planctomycetota bacterium]MDP6502758.1 hypothetical protein [Planctomycetota bacterium]
MAVSIQVQHRILLLANDDKIKDESILAQIKRQQAKSLPSRISAPVPHSVSSFLYCTIPSSSHQP